MHRGPAQGPRGELRPAHRRRAPPRPRRRGRLGGLLRRDRRAARAAADVRLPARPLLGGGGRGAQPAGGRHRVLGDSRAGGPHGTRPDPGDRADRPRTGAARPLGLAPPARRTRGGRHLGVHRTLDATDRAPRRAGRHLAGGGGGRGPGLGSGGCRRPGGAGRPAGRGAGRGGSGGVLRTAGGRGRAGGRGVAAGLGRVRAGAGAGGGRAGCAGVGGDVRWCVDGVRRCRKRVCGGGCGVGSGPGGRAGTAAGVGRVDRRSGGC